MPINRNHAFGGHGVSRRPARVIADGLAIFFTSPLLSLRRVLGYLLDPALWSYARAWRQFRRMTRIAESCWLGPNAWCSTYCDQVDRERLEIRPHTIIRGLLRVETGGRILIEENCYIGDDCILDSAESIVIGKHSMLAHGVSVFDNDSHPIAWDARAAQGRAYQEGRAGLASRPASAAVRIGEHVWIGFNAFVAKGVTVGDRSIIAACSVVTRDVPADSLVAGNPARVVRSLAPGEAASLDAGAVKLLGIAKANGPRS